MANELLAVIYRPHEHAEEYIVFIDDEAEYKEWKAQPQGGKSIALARFIGNFEIVSVPSASRVTSHLPRNPADISTNQPQAASPASSLPSPSKSSRPTSSPTTRR